MPLRGTRGQLNDSLSRRCSSRSNYTHIAMCPIGDSAKSGALRLGPADMGRERLRDFIRPLRWARRMRPGHRLVAFIRTEKEGFEPSRQGLPHLTP